MRLLGSLVLLLALPAPAVAPDELVAMSEGMDTDHARRMLQEEEDLSAVLPPKVLGGKPAEPGEFPFMASLRFPENYRSRRKRGNHFCGGILIRKNVVVTAAHCLQKRVKVPDVHVGRFLRDGPDDGRFEAFKVKKVIQHENYQSSQDGGYHVFDIALLVLDGVSEITPMKLHTSKICFNEGLPCGGSGTVMGWGATVADNRRSLAEKLLKVNVPLVPRSTCNSIIDNIEITKEMMCAGGQKGKDTCDMDSGGPLLLNGRMAGIVSFGIGCGLAGFPGVYANVPELSGWIQREFLKLQREEDKSRKCCKYVFGKYRPNGCRQCG